MKPFYGNEMHPELISPKETTEILQLHETWPLDIKATNLRQKQQIKGRKIMATHQSLNKPIPPSITPKMKAATPRGM